MIITKSSPLNIPAFLIKGSNCFDSLLGPESMTSEEVDDRDPPNPVGAGSLYRMETRGRMAQSPRRQAADLSRRRPLSAIVAEEDAENRKPPAADSGLLARRGFRGGTDRGRPSSPHGIFWLTG